MKILVVGNGAREHAIASALHRSPQKPELYTFMTAKNPGIAKLCKSFKIGDTRDAKAVTGYALNNNINFAVVGPEAPLAAGVADDVEVDRGARVLLVVQVDERMAIDDTHGHRTDEIRHRPGPDLLALLQVPQIVQAGLDGPQLLLIQPDGDFFAVAGNEGDGVVLVQQLDGAGDLIGFEAQFVGDGG